MTCGRCGKELTSEEVAANKQPVKSLHDRGIYPNICDSCWQDTCEWLQGPTGALGPTGPSA